MEKDLRKISWNFEKIWENLRLIWEVLGKNFKDPEIMHHSLDVLKKFIKDFEEQSWKTHGKKILQNTSDKISNTMTNPDMSNVFWISLECNFR